MMMITNCYYCDKLTKSPKYTAGQYKGYPSAYPHSPLKVPHSVRPLCVRFREGLTICLKYRVQGNVRGTDILLKNLGMKREDFE